MVQNGLVATKQALELKWHEEHPDEGDDERISAYKEVVLRRVRERQWAMLGDLAGKRVLEVGCGVGRETVELATRGARVVAVDLSPTLVAKARRRATASGVGDRVEFWVGAAEELAPDDARFDVVLGNGVLHHLDILAFKRSLVGLMRPGGVAQFQEPLVHNPLLRLYRALTPHLHTPTERALADADVADFVRGFSSVRVEYFNFLGLSLLAAPYVLGKGVARALLKWTAKGDGLLFARYPALRKYCQYVVIQVGSPA